MKVEKSFEKKVSDRIEELNNKANQAEDLYKEAQKIETRRTEATKKDHAFNDLKQEFVYVENQFRSTKQWVDVAREFEIKVDPLLDKKLILGIKDYTDRFSQRQYTSFKDEDEINTIRRRIESKRKKIRDSTKDIRENTQSEASELLESVLQKETLLQIPDIGSEDARQVCNDLESTLKSIKRDELSPDTAEIYRRQQKEYDSLKISLDRYNLTDTTEQVIWELLDDETVTLADIDESVLSDLKTLEEFSNKLTIQFKS